MIPEWIAALRARYGPQRWWPADSPFEVMAGAVLVQHSAWTNAARAVGALKERGLLSARRIAGLTLRRLAALVRPAGLPRVKARRLRALARRLASRPAGTPTRDELLGIDGVGPETADAILLYAYGKAEFVASAYARRVLARHGLAPAGVGYGEAKAVYEGALPRDAALFNESHALLVAVGKAHCRAEARCSGCPLERFLPNKKPPGLAAGGSKVRSIAVRPGEPPARPPRGSR